MSMTHKVFKEIFDDMVMDTTLCLYNYLYRYVQTKKTSNNAVYNYAVLLTVTLYCVVIIDIASHFVILCFLWWRFMCLVTCPVTGLLKQNVGVWHAGAGHSGSSETLCYPLQTAGGGWAAHPVVAGRRHPNRQHGREHPGMWILIYGFIQDHQVIRSLATIRKEIF